MKHFLLILSLLMSVVCASGQGYRHDNHDLHNRQAPQMQRGNHRKGDRPRERNLKVKRRVDGKHMDREQPRTIARNRAEVRCVKDWQELWNGRHVRLLNGRVSVLEYDGDTVVRGDEVVLLSNGCYKVRTGDIWRVYDSHGSTTSISGHEIIAWPNGLYCVRFSDFWRVYDEDGDRLTNVWGDSVELYGRNLIHCRRSGRSFYYDFHGNERK